MDVLCFGNVIRLHVLWTEEPSIPTKVALGRFIAMLTRLEPSPQPSSNTDNCPMEQNVLEDMCSQRHSLDVCLTVYTPHNGISL